MTLAVGDAAPDFTLKDQDGNEHTLSSHRGERPVVLVFVPFAFTGICQGELCSLSEDLNQFEAAGAQLYGLTCDRQFSIKAWTDQAGINFPVLSDGWPHGATAQAYGCFNEDLGCAMRRTIVIDSDGNVAKIFQSGGIGEPREKADYEAALAELTA
ncbi:MAG: peroxiredoxin [Acidimicrobiia bacterium]|nr:peroxiredoxin [Acidimicrobiia bacterium]